MSLWWLENSLSWSILFRMYTSGKLTFESIGHRLISWLEFSLSIHLIVLRTRHHSRCRNTYWPRSTRLRTNPESNTARLLTVGICAFDIVSCPGTIYSKTYSDCKEALLELKNSSFRHLNNKSIRNFGTSNFNSKIIKSIIQNNKTQLKCRI